MIEVARRNGVICCDVQDSGGGVEEALRERIFDMGISTKPGSGGWGLYPHPQVSLGVRGNPHSNVHGSDRLDVYPHVSGEMTMATQSPIEILLVEDQEDTRIAASLMLRSRGFTVLSPDSAEAARSVMASKGSTLAVAIFDMWLIEPRSTGRSTGAELAVELREKHGGRDTQILAWSVFHDFVYVTGAMRARAAAYLSKSVNDAADLIRHVRVLAIRWMLGQAMRGDGAGGRALVRAAHKDADLLKEYTQRIVVPALERCLGAPFAIVMVESTKVVGSWGELGRLSGANEEAEGPPLRTRAPRSWQDGGTVHAIAPLLQRGSTRIVLTMQQVPRDQGANIMAESVEPLATLVSQFLRLAIRGGLTQAVRAYEELRTVRTAANLAALAQSGVQAARQLLPGSDKDPANAAGLPRARWSRRAPAAWHGRAPGSRLGVRGGGCLAGEQRAWTAHHVRRRARESALPALDPGARRSGGRSQGASI